MRTCVSSAISPLFPVSPLPSRPHARSGTDRASAGWPSPCSIGQAEMWPRCRSPRQRLVPASRLPVYFRRLLPDFGPVNHPKACRMALTGLCITFVKILRVHGEEEQNSAPRGATDGAPESRGVGLCLESARTPRRLQRRPEGGAHRHPVRGARTPWVPRPGTLGPPVQSGLRDVLDLSLRVGAERH